MHDMETVSDQLVREHREWREEALALRARVVERDREIQTLRGRVVELEAGDVKTEWRVRDGWHLQLGPVVPYESWARKRADEYGHAAVVERHEVRTSPWRPVEQAGAVR